jgi:hypothetical protein
LETLALLGSLPPLRGILDGRFWDLERGHRFGYILGLGLRQVRGIIAERHKALNTAIRPFGNCSSCESPSRVLFFELT